MRFMRSLSRLLQTNRPAARIAFPLLAEETTMKLYYSPGACSLSPHIALREAGLAFEPVLASTKSHKLQDGTDYYAINPLGYVPLLELDDGTRLREGPAIVQYIADQAPLKNLAPANGTLPRYRLQEWLTFIGTEIHKTFSPLFNPAIPEDVKQVFKEKLASRFAWVDRELAGKDYLMGDHFTVADGYLYVVTRWTEPMKIDISGLPNLTAHHKRVAARPAVQEALKAEGLLKA
jgi:glutathione S-transferase